MISSHMQVRYSQMAAMARLTRRGSARVGLPTTPSGVPKRSIQALPSISCQRFGRWNESTEPSKKPSCKKPKFFGVASTHTLMSTISGNISSAALVSDSSACTNGVETKSGRSSPSG